MLKLLLDRKRCFYSEKKTQCILQSHAELSQPATTGAAGSLVINERRQREREKNRKRKEGKNRKKEREADRLGSPPPLSNQGGESAGPMFQAQLHVNPIIVSHKHLNSHNVRFI